MTFIKANKSSSAASSANNTPFFRPQEKLKVGNKADSAEREADQVADKVVQRSELLGKGLLGGPAFIQPRVQLHEENSVQKETESDEVEVQEKPIAENITQLKLADDDETKPIQKKCKECGTVSNNQEEKCPTCQKKAQKVQLSSEKEGESTGNLEEALNSSKGQGEKMDSSTLGEMNNSFGTDFSGVHIHTGSNAIQMSQDLGAQAFTHGSDVYFNQGKYDPSSKEGKHLLAHELTHTVQQGAVGKSIQKKDVVIQRKTIKESVDIIEDALQGYTSRWDSEKILAEFVKHRGNKAKLEELLTGVKGRASNNGETSTGMINWLFDDLTAENARSLRNLLIKAKVSAVNQMVADLVYDYLSGYTSASDSNGIIGILMQYGGSQLDDVLTKLEKKSKLSEADTREWLFSDLTSVHSEKMRIHFLTNGGLKAANKYGAIHTATKIYNLLSGYTSVSDSWSIVSNFERTPANVRSLVLYQLDVLTGTDWGERKSADALMQDMNKSDYEKLVLMKGMTLPQYDYEKGWLEWGWDGLMSIVDWAGMIIQWGVCGLVGIVTGVISVVADIVVLVKDLGVAVWNLIQSFAYLVSGGGVGSEGWLAVKDFFRGLGQLWNAPGEVIQKAWDEMVLEGELIEGPFEACKEAEFWVRKVVNLFVNIILILFAGYGAVKLGASGLKTIASVISKSGYRKGLIELGSMVLKGSGQLVKGLGDDAIRVIRGLTTPVETMGKVSVKLNKLKLAAEEVGYWKFLRQQAGMAVEGELTFWKENKEFWKELADSRKAKLDQLDNQVGKLMDDIEGNKVPADADTKVNNISNETKKLNDEVDDALGNVQGTKKSDKEPKRVESGVSEDPLEFVTNTRANSLSPRQENFLHRLALEDDVGVGVARVGKREVTPTDLATLTSREGVEFAIVMDSGGQRYLVRGESFKAVDLPEYTHKLLIHSHPNDYGSGVATWISEADIRALAIFQQEYSYMVTVDGRVWRFTRQTAPNGTGELVRELNYYGWGTPNY